MMRDPFHVPSRQTALLIRAAAFRCALPIETVIETMRPLPIEPVSGMPPFVLGLASIRGVATPVLDLALLLGGMASPTPARFVTLRTGDRTVALRVDEIVGVRRLSAARLEVSPLLGPVAANLVETLELLDREFLMVLRTGHLLPEDLWLQLVA